MIKTVKYDKAQYERHLQTIANLEAELAKIKQELATADRRIIDGWLMGSEARYLTQQASKIQQELNALRNKNIEVIDASEETSVVSIGHIYHVIIKYPTGETNERTFKLVEENPFIGGPGQIAELSIKSPIGASIYGKEVGSVCDFKIPNQAATCKVKVLEEVKFQTTEQDEM